MSLRSELSGNVRASAWMSVASLAGKAMAVFKTVAIASIFGVSGSLDAFWVAFVIPNILPGGMTRLELFERYVPLMEKTLDWASFKRRVIGYVENISYEPALRSEGGQGPRQLPDELRAYIGTLEEDVRGHVLEILKFTAERAPAQMHNVVTLIVRHSIEVDNLPQVRATVERQIAFERGRDLSRCLVSRPARPALIPLTPVTTASTVVAT